jgi:hypothetical protein
MESHCYILEEEAQWLLNACELALMYYFQRDGSRSEGLKIIPIDGRHTSMVLSEEP